MTLSNLGIRSFRPSREPDAPLTPRQLEQLTALLEILDQGDGVLRLAHIGPVVVGHLFVLYRVTPVSSALVEAWNPEHPGLAARLAAARSAYVSDVLVKDGYRRLGIATALMRDAVELARGQRLDRVALHVSPDNVAAVRLYERLRFVRHAEAPDLSIEYVLSLR